jgi:hypothetical protein
MRSTRHHDMWLAVMSKVHSYYLEFIATVRLLWIIKNILISETWMMNANPSETGWTQRGTCSVQRVGESLSAGFLIVSEEGKETRLCCNRMICASLSSCC